MKQPFSKRPHKNLVQTIRMAESVEEIEAAMAFGSSLDDASDKTRSRWHEAAKHRRQELSEGETQP